jgi:hypothetical protein
VQPQSRPYQPQPGYGRSPLAGECQLCGSAPAIKTNLPSLTGLVVAYQFSWFKGWFCRDCGIAIHREQTAKTLVRGWWSLTGPLAVPVLLLANLFRWFKLSRMAAPRPSPGVAAPNPRPLPPGRPLFQRPVMLMLVMALPAVLVLGICAWAVVTE